ncbi:MAG: hypothetical protein MI784_13700 [Cytophagales bacterium]|nr:hypothetical protein [Cytophagales bacterium]
MKKIFFLFLSFMLLAETQGQPADQAHTEHAIYQAYLEFFRAGNRAKLDKQIQRLRPGNSDQDYYWGSYAMYLKAITLLETDKKKAKEWNRKAMALLEKMHNKDSEYYALLATERNLSLDFLPFYKIPFQAKQVLREADKSLKLDSVNIRAFLVKGVNSYYTPKSFGGGTKVEQCLLKVLELKRSATSSVIKASWGKREAYWYLIQYYKKTKNKTAYKEYCRKALKAYPEDPNIRQLTAE